MSRSAILSLAMLGFFVFAALVSGTNEQGQVDPPWWLPIVGLVVVGWFIVKGQKWEREDPGRDRSPAGERRDSPEDDQPDRRQS